MHTVIEIHQLDDAPYQRLKAGFGVTPVGPASVVWDSVGVRALSFGATDALMQLDADRGAVVMDDDEAASLLGAAFGGRWRLPIVLCGTDFARRVWVELTRLSLGQTVSYGELANRLGMPGGARAVGGAVGANRVGFLVPCHRVVRADGVIGQFRWGTDTKRSLLNWEFEQINKKRVLVSDAKRAINGG